MATFTNSYLVDVVVKSPNYSTRSGNITKITIHHMAGCLTAKDCGGCFSTTSRKASSNYGIGTDGKIGLYVDEKNRAWTSSNSTNDNMAVTIEVANSKYGDEYGWPVSDLTYRKMIELCVDICRRNKIPKLIWTGDSSGTLTCHYMFAATACPGPYLKARMGKIADEVNKYLDQDTNYSSDSSITNCSSDNNNGYNQSSSNVVVSGQTAYEYAVSQGVLPDAETMTPYVVTLNRNSKKIDWNNLKKLGVLGCIVEAGYLYDATHKEQEFRNPLLRDTVKECIDNSVPYGLYFQGKARNEEEIRAEMKQLNLCIRSFPPSLGVWLIPTFSTTPTKNDSLILLYQKYLEQLGLQGQIGLYTTRSEIKKIDWETHCENWLLWLDDHITAFTNVDQLLTPQFFALDNSDGGEIP